MVSSDLPPAFGVYLLGGVIRIILIFSGAFLLLWYYLKNRQKQQPDPVQKLQTDVEKSELLRAIMPLRLQALERFVLFLERIHPSNLVMRLNNPDLSSVQLQSLLVRTIREEFEYNLSQQLYISTQTWELIRNSKEEMISLVNQASARAGEQAMASDLVKIIFDLTMEKGRLPSETALEEVKQELKKLG